MTVRLFLTGLFLSDGISSRVRRLSINTYIFILFLPQHAATPRLFMATLQLSANFKALTVSRGLLTGTYAGSLLYTSKINSELNLALNFKLRGRMYERRHRLQTFFEISVEGLGSLFRITTMSMKGTLFFVFLDSLDVICRNESGKQVICILTSEAKRPHFPVRLSHYSQSPGRSYRDSQFQGQRYPYQELVIKTQSERRPKVNGKE